MVFHILPYFLASPDPHADKSLVNVEFDDGDTGKIPIDHIRLIPQDFPIVGELLVLSLFTRDIYIIYI